MKITTFESGSTGNLHLLEMNGCKLLLECGISMKKIKNYLDHDLDLDGCLLSHYHGDHSKSAVKIMESGVNVYCSHGTADYLGLKSHRLKIINESWFKIGPFGIKAIPTNHDTQGSYAFLIVHNESGERVLFCTDTGSFPYKIPGLNYIMIECNYLESTMEDQEVVKKSRILKTHMGLSDTIAFLKNNDLTNVKEIRLIHLSDRNSDPDYFKSEIQKLTGKLTIIS